MPFADSVVFEILFKQNPELFGEQVRNLWNGKWTVMLNW